MEVAWTSQVMSLKVAQIKKSVGMCRILLLHRHLGRHRRSGAIRQRRLHNVKTVIIRFLIAESRLQHHNNDHSNTSSDHTQQQPTLPCIRLAQSNHQSFYCRRFYAAFELGHLPSSTNYATWRFKWDISRLFDYLLATYYGYYGSRTKCWSGTRFLVIIMIIVVAIASGPVHVVTLESWEQRSWICPIPWLVLQQRRLLASCFMKR